jgi:hypothetical protein
MEPTECGWDAPSWLFRSKEQLQEVEKEFDLLFGPEQDPPKADEEDEG